MPPPYVKYSGYDNQSGEYYASISIDGIPSIMSERYPLYYA